MRLLGGMALVVDGVQQQLGQLLIYRGMMYGGVPNFANVFGYTNASWTLKADLSCAYVCRLLNIMARRGYVSCTPQVDPAMTADATVNFTSGYIQRALADLPKQGSKAPWKLYQNYALDLLSLRFGRVKDGVLQFTRKPSPRPAPAAAAAPLPGRG
jgi:hypothetical protein